MDEQAEPIRRFLRTHQQPLHCSTIAGGGGFDQCGVLAFDVRVRHMTIVRRSTGRKSSRSSPFLFYWMRRFLER
jgi:hypothetical protein